MDTKKRRWLSATQIAMWCRCPRQYAFRYLENLKIPPSGVMKQSGVFHAGAEHNYRQKADTHQDLPLSEMTDRYAQTWEDELQREEVIFDKDAPAAKLKDQGIAIVTQHHTVIAPMVQPQNAESVERKLLYPLKESQTFDLMGVLDVIDDQGYIRDNKAMAANRVPKPIDLAKDPQLSMYALLYRLIEKKAEAGLRLDVVIKSKTPKATILPAERSRESLLLHLNKIGHVARAIEHEIFPLNTDGWHCDPKWCGYWNRCVGKDLKIVDLKPGLQQDLTETLEQSIAEVTNGK
jgi:PD-(D/E)XK nuclease superfamily protein